MQLVVEYSHKVIFTTVSRSGELYIMGMDFGAMCTMRFWVSVDMYMLKARGDDDDRCYWREEKRRERAC